MSKGTSRVTDKIIREKIELLKADDEFLRLKKLVPSKLRGKELGKDICGITTDTEALEKTKGERVISLSSRDWDKYERFKRLCDKLAQRYWLNWATIEDLAMGIRQPTCSPRQSRTIKAYLDPVVSLPKEFDSNGKYVAHSTVVPPLEAIEIMRRVQGLDEKVKEEIKAYLFWLFKDKHGCHIVELCGPEDSPQKENEEIELDICLRIPIGYPAREVTEVYRKVDNKRREILATLGLSVPKRRRQSQTLMDTESLRLLEPGVNIYDIIDNRYPDNDLSQDQVRRRRTINQRYKGRKLLKKHLQM